MALVRHSGSGGRGRLSVAGAWPRKYDFSACRSETCSPYPPSTSSPSINVQAIRAASSSPACRARNGQTARWGTRDGLGYVSKTFSTGPASSLAQSRSDSQALINKSCRMRHISRNRSPSIMHAHRRGHASPECDERRTIAARQRLSAPRHCSRLVLDLLGQTLNEIEVVDKPDDNFWTSGPDPYPTHPARR